MSVSIGGPSITERLAAAREAVAQACRDANRDPATVRIVAVSKRKPVQAVLEAMAAGQTEFAENYLQEGEQKIAAVAAVAAVAAASSDSPCWHFVGHLQSGKAAPVARCFEVIQGLDSSRAAAKLARIGRDRSVPVRVFLQICLAEGGDRAGVAPQDAARFLDAIVDPAGLVVEGVMAVAPADGDPRPHFARLRECAKILRALGLPGAPVTEISAGMSGDFVEAIREGATIVRLGSAIFGPRLS